MSLFFLKLLAVITMLIDHIGYGFAGNQFWMRFIGRTAFILYAFMMAESFFHLREKPERLKSHMGKLLVLSLFTELPYDLFTYKSLFYWKSQNVIFTLFVGFLALAGCGLWRKKHAGAAGSAGCAGIFLMAAALAYLIRSDYGCAGVSLIFLFYLYLKKADTLPPGRKIAFLLAVFAVNFVIYTWSGTEFGGWTESAALATGLLRYYPGMLIPVLPICLYNRKRGSTSRWFNALYSWFYPAHMAFLFLIRRFIL